MRLLLVSLAGVAIDWKGVNVGRLEKTTLEERVNNQGQPWLSSSAHFCIVFILSTAALFLRELRK